MKRLFDIVLALSFAPFWLPLIVLISAMVVVKMGRPIFFKQKRPGRHGKLFEIVKFRTMTNQRDEQGNLCSDELRLSAFGKFLRSTSLDELPELWNVLKGDMSLIGPRPLLVEYLSLYSPEQARRHEAMPGLTGWAQVNGRNAISWEEKFKLDVWYVDHQSFGLDLKILCLTVFKVLSRHGISSQDQATANPFKGQSS